jgi:hypothetical protein
MQHVPIHATFDTTPSPHGRINAPSLLLAFTHIHGEVGKPSLGICSAVVGRNERSVCSYVYAEGVDFHATRPHSRYIQHHPVSARANQCT